MIPKVEFPIRTLDLQHLFFETDHLALNQISSGSTYIY